MSLGAGNKFLITLPDALMEGRTKLDIGSVPGAHVHEGPKMLGSLTGDTLLGGNLLGRVTALLLKYRESACPTIANHQPSCEWQSIPLLGIPNSPDIFL